MISTFFLAFEFADSPVVFDIAGSWEYFGSIHREVGNLFTKLWLLNDKKGLATDTDSYHQIMLELNNINCLSSISGME